MAIEQLKVHEIVKQAVSKNVDIPEFQREFVWDAEQVKLLAESLYRDYPVGSFLLWDSFEYQEAKTAEGTQASLWIVDGQQRTTALCLLLGEKPYWWPSFIDWNKALERYDVMVNLLPDEGDERLEFAMPNPIRRRDPCWVSIREILSLKEVGDLAALAQKVVSRISDGSKQSFESFGKILASLQNLWQIRERDIPIIKISHEVEDVAEIFARLNQAGTRVKEADVILAVAAVRNPGWVREEYLPFRNDLAERGWDLDAGIFIRTMSGIGYHRARLIEVPKSFWDPESLASVWRKTHETIADVIKRVAEFGILNADLLPSTNSLIPLFVLHNKWQDKPGYHFGKALRWFLLANRDGRYSGSAITSLNEDVRTIAEANSFNMVLESLFKRLRVSFEIKDEEFLNRYDRAGNRFLRLMLYLVLFDRKASDWVNGILLGYDKTGGPLNMGFEPQWHHIFPRKQLVKANLPIDEIHALSNITVLSERTNANKLSGKEPWHYIKQFQIPPETLRRHLIPESFVEVLEDEDRLKEQWSVEQYRDFLIERAQLLAREANKFLHKLENSVS
jgi:hypothetical protein